MQIFEPHGRQLWAHSLATTAGHAVHALQPHIHTRAVLRRGLHIPWAGRERSGVLRFRMCAQDLGGPGHAAEAACHR